MTSTIRHAARWVTAATLLFGVAGVSRAQEASGNPPRGGPVPTAPSTPPKAAAPAGSVTAQPPATGAPVPQPQPSQQPGSPSPSQRAAVASVPQTAPPKTAPVSGGGEAPHGAAPMEQQLKILASLGHDASGKNAPAGVTPEFWKTIVPADNVGNEARVALGRKLYFDPSLSRDGTVACATCHDVTRGFTDRRNVFEGVGDSIGQRNSPTTLNAAFFSTQFLDGRAATLEEQALLPIVNPIEMGQPNGDAVVASISKDPEYQKMFQAAYGRPVNYADVGRAIAAFERTLIFMDAPFDRFARGDANAISVEARAGWALFNGKARCVSCHQMSSSNPIGTDNRFHNIGVSARHQNFEQLARQGLEALKKDSSAETIDKLALQTNLSELGRFVVTRNRSDIGAFKTSQLRNVGITAPYMHDGSMATLWDVMDHYNKGGEVNPYLDGGIEPLALTEQEVNQLVEFMFTLTDLRFADQNKGELARQREIAGKRRPFRDENAAQRKVLPFELRVTAKR